MDKYIVTFFLALLLSLSISSAYAGTDLVGCKENCRKTITWTGCGISKKGFMKEIANIYGKQHDLTFALSGGGATKGIRDVVKGGAHMGGMCLLPLLGPSVALEGETEGVMEEKDSLLIPMAW